MINYELKLPATPATKKTRSQIARDWMVDKAKRPSSDGYYEEFKKLITDARKKDEALAKEKKHLKDLILFGLENSSEPVIKNPVMRAALEAKPKPKKNINDYKPTAKKPFKVVPKIKPGPPVEIDYDLGPRTAFIGLWPTIKDSSIYKLLDDPKVMGVELGHEGIMEAIRLLQNSGMLKKGGRVK